jgi:hypothetical protein
VIAANLPSSSKIPLPGLTRKTTSKTTRVKPRTGTRQTAVRASSQRRVSARSGGAKADRSGMSTGAIAAVVGGLLVLAIGIIMLAFGGSGGSAGESRSPNRTPRPNPKEKQRKPRGETGGREDGRTAELRKKAETALQVARSYIGENPDDISTARDLFKTARDLGAGTHVADEADAEIRRLTKRVNRKSKDRFDDARSKAMVYAVRGDIDGALADLDGMPESLRKQHEADVAEAVGEIERAGRARIEELIGYAERAAGQGKPDEAEEALMGLENVRYKKGMADVADRLASARDKIAKARGVAKKAAANIALGPAAQILLEFDKLVAQGDYDGAGRRVQRAAGEVAKGPAAARVRAAAGVANVLKDRSAALKRGARTQIGKMLAIESTKGKTEGVVSEVNDDDVRVAMDIVDRGRVMGQSKMTVKWEDLTPGQEGVFLALGAWRATDDEKAIAEAYRALSVDDLERAKLRAGAAPTHPLSSYLVSKIAVMRAMRAEAGARAAWAEIAGLAKADPLSAATAKLIDVKIKAFKKEHAAAEFAKAKSKRLSDLEGRIDHAKLGGALGRGLVGWWKFDEGTGDQAADSSGKGAHGTVVGAEWFPGRIGGALMFNGKGAHVAIGDHPQLRYSAA